MRQFVRRPGPVHLVIQLGIIGRVGIVGMTQRLGRQRERDPERRPLALGRAYRRDTALGRHQRAHDRQAQPAAPGGAGVRVLAWSAR